MENGDKIQFEFCLKGETNEQGQEDIELSLNGKRSQMVAALVVLCLDRDSAVSGIISEVVSVLCSPNLRKKYEAHVQVLNHEKQNGGKVEQPA